MRFKGNSMKMLMSICLIVVTTLLSSCSFSEYADIGSDIQKTVQKDIKGIVDEIDSSNLKDLLKKVGILDTEESGPTDYIQLYKEEVGMGVEGIAVCLNCTHTYNYVVAVYHDDKYYTFGNLTTSDGTPYVESLNDTLRDKEGNPILFTGNYVNLKKYAGSIQAAIYDTKEFPDIVVNIVNNLDEEGWFQKRNVYDKDNKLVGYIILTE